MIKIQSFSIVVCLLFLPLSSIQSQNADSASVNKQYGILDLWGIGIKATTNGVGFEAVKGFGTRLNVRLGYSFLNIPISRDVPMEGYSAKVEANLKFGGANLFLDFYPVKKVIHLTAGVLQNAMRHTVTLTPTSDYPYGDIMVPAADLGIVEAIITPEIKFAPYFALGFGNTLSREHRVSFNFELGTFYQGAPQLSLTGTKKLNLMGSDNNEQLIMAAVAQYKWYPLISLQLTYSIRR
ncbi:MAG: hypothetical protein WC865_15320 [Bacteroidales bacterium]